MTIIFLSCFFVILTTINPGFAAESKTTPASPTSDYELDVIRQQMILFGLYIYGLNTELSRKIPKSDEVRFLSESMIETLRRLRKIKQDDKIFHQNLNELETKLVDLNLVSQDTPMRVKPAIRNVVDQCSKCHMVKPDEIEQKILRDEFLNARTQK